MTDKKHDTDVAFIKALAELLRENDLTELAGQARLWRRRQPEGAGQPQSAGACRRAGTGADDGADGPAPVAAAPAAAPAPGAVHEDPASHPGAVTSPMVGTVYMQAEPGAPAFVNVGASVAEGDTLLIVEAMKTMNHIPAPRAGTVRRILVEDGAAVEYGTPLVIIE